MLLSCPPSPHFLPPGPKTRHFPSGEEMDIFDAAERYQKEGRPVVVLAGKEYGSGSSRDWAAKGPWMLVCRGSEGRVGVLGWVV